MKLDCEVVQDLYPLYEENELSPKVKKAVEAHLESCDACRAVYESGNGFNDMLKTAEAQEKEPPKKLDDKIKLRFKLRRMTFIAVILLTIIVVSVIKNYMNERDQLGNAFDRYYAITRDLNDALQTVKDSRYDNLDSMKSQLFYDEKDQNQFIDHLNWFEKRKLRNSDYSLFLLNTSFFNTLTTLQNHYDQGTWTKEDEKAYQNLSHYINQFQTFIKNNDQPLRLSKTRYFKFVNIPKMTAFYTHVNRLTFYYTRFQKMPAEVHEHSKASMTKALRQAFGAPNGSVTFKKMSPLGNPIGQYSFTLKDKNGLGVFGHIDAFSNTVIQVDTNNELTTGKLINKNVALNNALNDLKKVYGANATFKLHFEGMNVNLSGDPNLKVYSFSFIPTKKQFELIPPAISKNVINIDARTGKLFSIFLIPSDIFTPDFYKTDVLINVSNQQGLAIVQKMIKQEPDNTFGKDYTYHFVRTGILFSKNSSRYVPVHVYESNKGNVRIFINTVTGKQEEPYYFSD